MSNEGWEGEVGVCPACNGRRLRPEALAVRFHNRTIAEFTELSVEAAEKLFRRLPRAPTLSGGEAQRLRLASQLGSNLQGVCYILDEPTIGLHVRDNRLLLKTLKTLKAKGNTVVVEHDEETIRQAEHVVDLGPGAGVH